MHMLRVQYSAKIAEILTVFTIMIDDIYAIFYILLRGRPFDSEGGGGGWHFCSGQIIYFHQGLGRKIYFRVNRGQNIYFQTQQTF